MHRLKDIPTKTLLIVCASIYILLLYIQIPFVFQKNHTAVVILILLGFSCFILPGIRLVKHLRSKNSLCYQVIIFFVGYIVVIILGSVFLIIDDTLSLNGSLSIPGITVEAILILCFLFFRRRGKSGEKEYILIQKGIEQYSLDNLKSDFRDDQEIEFTYDSERYLFIHESDKYYFKRVKSIDPYEYEILSEVDDPEQCIDAAEINNKNMSEILNSIEDLTVY